MTTVNTTTTPAMGNLPRNATVGQQQAQRLALRTTHPTEAALLAILAEVTPGQRPFSGDSYLPDHLIEAARAALDGFDMEARQHAHNALSTAAWHVARGEGSQALARLRRAQSHIKSGMGESTTSGRA